VARSEKLELLYRIVVLGGLTLAGTLSWNLVTSSQEIQRNLVELVHEIDRRSTTNAALIDVNKSRINRNESRLDGAKPRK